MTIERSDTSQTTRIDRQTARAMLGRMPLGELMDLAHAERLRRHPRPLVTFVFDTNPNYTNICVTGCRFCAFCRRPGMPMPMC
jgi:cyclic dehypoxanthinyl futalosine synthase